MQSIIDQICQPFGWVGLVQGDNFGIYVEATDTGQVYLLTSGETQGINPWRVRSLAMYTYWYLITQGIQLPVIAITMETIAAMRAEVIEVKPVASPAIAERKIVGPEAFAVDPSELTSYVGARRIQHAPPATSPVGYTEDGEVEFRPGASPRRVMNGRLNW